MNRSILMALPLAVFAVACAPSADADSEEVASADADLTGVSDLATLESALALVKDPTRTRPEDMVKAGPCYQKLSAGDKPWNMRRYTKGAAFFYTNEAGVPLNPVVCVDLDVYGQGDGLITVALSGLTLDMALRFPLGSMLWSAPNIDSDGAGIQQMQFTKTQLAIAIKPSNLDYTFGDNIPSWEGRGSLRSVTGGFVPQDRTPLGPGQLVPKVSRLVPHVANLAYRYAKDDGFVSMTSDPIGRFVSVEDLSVGDFDAWKYVFHFEHADITYDVRKGHLGGDVELLSLAIREPYKGYAYCSRAFDGATHDFSCANRVGGKPWEDVLGHD